jgi:hypothetical protein
MTIGETWAYKTTAQEVSDELDYNTIFGRDVYSFWEPIDSQLLDVMFKLMHYKDYTGVMPFWAGYYFAYLTYGDPELEGLSGIELLTIAGAEAEQNWPTMTLTGTGERFRDLNLDADGDVYPNAMDNCPRWPNPTQALPNWNVPANDSDCDGYPDTAAPGLIAPESFIGTIATQHCSTTPDIGDEDPPDAWPPDFNDNQLVNGADWLTFNSRFGSSAAGGPPYDVRWDLNGSGLINGADMLQLNQYFGKRCA